MLTPKRVLAVHDLCGIGRCSLSVALPILSAMGVQCCPLPTAYFSAPTNIPGFTCLDMTAQMEPALTHWSSLGLRFDAIYSGFLASAAQTEHIERAMSLFPDAIFVVDPVMGEGGTAYRTCTPELIGAMRRLAAKACVITPNLTEACFLLERDPGEKPLSPEELPSWLEPLSDGRRSVALTGLLFGRDKIATGWLDIRTGRRGVHIEPLADRACHGAGDIFASVLTGMLLREVSFGEAVGAAARFTGDCAALTLTQETPPGEGLLFEPLLGGIIPHPLESPGPDPFHGFRPPEGELHREAEVRD